MSLSLTAKRGGEMFAALMVLALQAPPQGLLGEGGDAPAFRVAESTSSPVGAPMHSDTASFLGMTVSISSRGATIVSIERDDLRVQGFREGDFIVLAGGRPVQSKADLAAAISTARSHGAVVLLGVRRQDGGGVFLSIPTDD